MDFKKNLLLGLIGCFCSFSLLGQQTTITQQQIQDFNNKVTQINDKQQITSQNTATRGAALPLQNLMFENWTSGTYTDEKPVGWGTLNIDAVGGPKTTYEDTTNPAEGGSSVLLETDDGYQDVIPSWPDTIGGLVSATEDYTNIPTAITFQYQSYRVGIDTGFILAQLTKWDNKGDSAIVTAGAFRYFGSNVSSWTTETIDFSYYRCLRPDSIKIYVMSSKNFFFGGPTARVGSQVKFDSVVLHNEQFGTVNYSYSVNGLMANYTDNSNLESPMMTRFWDFGDGVQDTVPNPSHMFSDTGMYNTCLTLQDTFGRCVTNCKMINITCGATADFTYSGTCASDSTYFNNQSTPTNGATIDSVKWYFGDGDSSTMLNPVHKFDTTAPLPDTFMVRLYIEDSVGCTDWDSTQIIIDDNPPVVDLGPDTSFCADESYTLDAGGDASQVVWSTGDTSRMITVNYADTFWATGTSNCGSSSDTVILTTNPVPTVQAWPDTNICSGDTVTLWATAGYSSYMWSNGAMADSTIVGPMSKTTYWVTATDSNGCTNSDSATVGIEASPMASFTFNKQGGGDVQFTNNSTNASVWNWTFGDGNSSTSQDPNHTYDSTGTYNVCLRAINTKCNDTSYFCDSVSVVVNSIADKQDNPQIEIYPNPNEGAFEVNLSGYNSSTANVEVFNTLGEKIRGEEINLTTTSTFRMQQLESGVYFVKVHVQDKVAVRKVMVR